MEETSMYTLTIEDCPPSVQQLWREAEAKGFSDFAYSSYYGLTARFGASNERVCVFDIIEKLSDPRITHVTDARQSNPL